MDTQLVVNGAKQMARGTFRLRSRELLEKYNAEDSLYRVAKTGDLNYTTILRWRNEPESVQAVKLDVLYSFLAGLGLSADEIRRLSIGDVFDILLQDEAA
jgi:hypothetical protein